MSDYTPTTEQVRNCYRKRWYEQSERQSVAEFDRWLDSVRAEAWEEGYYATEGLGHHEVEASNPYEEEA